MRKFVYMSGPLAWSSLACFEILEICLKFWLFLSQNLRKMEGETEQPVKDLNELQNADWVRTIRQGHSSWMHNGAEYIQIEVWAMAKYVFFHRHGFGCRWWGTLDMVWSWRRSRSVNIILYPSSSSSRLMRCSWTTSAPSATNFARSWLVCTWIDEYMNWWILNWLTWLDTLGRCSEACQHLWSKSWTNKHESLFILYQQYSILPFYCCLWQIS